MADSSSARARFTAVLSSALIPGEFMAAQLRKPSGLFGRALLARGLNSGNAPLIDAALGALALSDDDRFLDVGFGGGLGLRRAAARTSGALYGVDFAPDMVVAGQRALGDLVAAGRLNLLTADVADLPLRDGCVDAICTTNTIYFWPDLAQALGELHRVLAPGGRVAFGFTGRDKMRRFDRITRHGFRTFVPEELQAALADAGFVKVSSRALSGSLQGDFVTLAATPSD